MKILGNRFVISNPRLYLAALLAAIVWANSGCRRSDAQFKELNQRVNTLSKLDDIYNQYVAGNRTEAKKCLLSGVELLENSSCFEENARAQLLSLEYSRLAVMEHKLGDNNAQDAYLLCAQYWQLKSLELSKESVTEAIEKVRQLDIEKQTLLVENMDKRLHGGKLASYNQDVEKGQTDLPKN